MCMQEGQGAAEHETNANGQDCITASAVSNCSRLVPSESKTPYSDSIRLHNN